MATTRELRQQARLEAEVSKAERRRQAAQAELREAEQHLANVRRKLAAAKAGIHDRDAALLRAAPRPVPNTGAPLTERIIELLDETPNALWTIVQIEEALDLPSESRASLTTTLAALAREDRIRRPKRGLYCSCRSSYALSQEEIAVLHS